MLLLLASLFFTQPVPLDMPRAEAYLVQEGDHRWLEDRFETLDLWVAHAVLGRWMDDDGRVFLLAQLDFRPPALAHDFMTRSQYVSSRVPLGRKDDILPSLKLLVSDELAESPRPPRQLPRGFREVEYWQHPTNFSSIVCAFLTEKGDRWHLAVWNLAEGDDYSERMQTFEREFLDRFRTGKDLPSPLAAHFAEPPRKAPRKKSARAAIPSERELLRTDAHHNVTNYVNWHAVDADEFTVLSDAPHDGDFLVALTNDLKTMRARYAATLPTPIDGSNVLCVARIFADHDEYLDAVDEEMSWTAAYWSPQRRELVAYLPPSGESSLLRTIRHEAFHQYLSYALSMISASPWLNEGYAQYFEDESSLDWGEDFDLTPERIDALAEALKGIFALDYEQFYAGSDRERRLKYRLAWSVAVFLEKGASEVRFQPFKNVKRDYVEALFDTRDMRRATSAAFRNADTLKLFVAEWKKFWKERGQ